MRSDCYRTECRSSSYVNQVPLCWLWHL